MLYTHTNEKRLPNATRPTLPQPRVEPAFVGWGPRLRY